MPTSKYFGPSGANARSPSETASAKFIAAPASPPAKSPAVETDPAGVTAAEGANPAGAGVAVTADAGSAATRALWDSEAGIVLTWASAA